MGERAWVTSEGIMAPAKSSQHGNPSRLQYHSISHVLGTPCARRGCGSPSFSKDDNVNKTSLFNMDRG